MERGIGGWERGTERGAWGWGVGRVDGYTTHRRSQATPSASQRGQTSRPVILVDESFS